MADNGEKIQPNAAKRTKDWVGIAHDRVVPLFMEMPTDRDVIVAQNKTRNQPWKLRSGTPRYCDQSGPAARSTCRRHR